MTHTLYATVDEFKAQSDIHDTDWDAVIQLCLDAAAETVDNVCNWGVPFVAGATATIRQMPGTGREVLYIPPCVAVTLVETKSSPLDAVWTALAGTSWVAFSGDERFPTFDDKPYTGLMLTGTGIFSKPAGAQLPTVRVTARWGRAENVPAVIQEATIAQAYRWFKRGQGSWGDALGNADMGLIMFKKALDPDIQMLLVNGRLIRPAI